MLVHKKAHINTQSKSMYEYCMSYDNKYKEVKQIREMRLKVIEGVCSIQKFNNIAGRNSLKYTIKNEGINYPLPFLGQKSDNKNRNVSHKNYYYKYMISHNLL